MGRVGPWPRVRCRRVIAAGHAARAATVCKGGSSHGSAFTYPLIGLMLFLTGCGKGVLESLFARETHPSQTVQDGTRDDIVADYFPLKEGLTWRYEDRTTAIRVTASNPTIYGPAYTVQGLMQDRVLRKTLDGQALELCGDSWRLLFDLGAAEKASWTSRAPGEPSDLLDGAKVTLESRSDRVTTPFGGFPNCILLTVRPREGLFDAGVSRMWFAPGVGLVKWSESWIGGERVHELTGFGAAEPVIRRPE